MKRRGFLASLLAAPVASVLPPAAAVAMPVWHEVQKGPSIKLDNIRERRFHMIDRSGPFRGLA